MAPFWVAGAGLVLVTAAAWIFVIASSGDDDMDMVPSAGAYIGSWTVMMAAMMLPSVAPFALLYARGASTAGRSRASRGSAISASGRSSGSRPTRSIAPSEWTIRRQRLPS